MSLSSSQPIQLASPQPHATMSPIPTSHSPTGIVPPQQSKGIFVTYQPDRRPTPDLEDILSKKKVAQTWGRT
ncbi:hypothetical protein HETIRDRAFT_141440 [Heterobasidion irregulare TC 32-1]|uniref:Uncharacterized protein n=1 Tax=Heterobasidion irregulare (strain TC 32-1) TaxID=747525 RepID=W4KK86_HETIT|nr:uncharacterized protein HETIRDRAFT_141440 [Heterobasidion irregulare TC 32-1]ETW85461.1 hypothetical protein HETIRDRAFT_141440 [Heterobasidion irregulare TC 32-1]